MSQSIRYAVGYQLPDDRDSTLEMVEDYRQHIDEVYFAWLGQASGRTPVGVLEGFEPDEARECMTEELTRLGRLGVKLTLLCNANCYGGQAASKTLSRKTLEHVGEMQEKFGIGAVTTASIASFPVTRIYSPKRPAASLACWRVIPVKSGTVTRRVSGGSPKYRSVWLLPGITLPGAGSWAVTVSPVPTVSAVIPCSFNFFFASAKVRPV